MCLSHCASVEKHETLVVDLIVKDFFVYNNLFGSFCLIFQHPTDVEIFVKNVGFFFGRLNIISVLEVFIKK